jgi:hypothetical protein
MEKDYFILKRTDGEASYMSWGREITSLEAVPAQAGDGWRIFIQWASGRTQYINGFESLEDAENWIATKAQDWVSAVNAQL